MLHPKYWPQIGWRQRLKFFLFDWEHCFKPCCTQGPPHPSRWAAKCREAEARTSWSTSSSRRSGPSSPTPSRQSCASTTSSRMTSSPPLSTPEMTSSLAAAVVMSTPATIFWRRMWGSIISCQLLGKQTGEIFFWLSVIMAFGIGGGGGVAITGGGGVQK